MMLEGLRARLPQGPQEIVLRDDVDMDLAAQAVATPAVRASVLLPIIVRAEPTLLFTRRTATLAKHSGQVSFPGGRSEPHDISPLQTALRETFEETGIAPGFVSVAGYLDRYLTGTGFDIQPVVGLLAPGFALAPDAREVDEIFEVPLAFLLDPANRRRESREIAGRQRRYYAFTYKEHEIWGATAAIIVNLAERML
ncbi:MAG: pyrophosphohydrolase [Alphaproteobacteria bacterium]|nr:pyrophosphohydrolase [Alphaproteobacteria bacterium]